MTLSERQSRAIAMLIEKRKLCLADINAYQNFRDTVDRPWLDITTELNNLHASAFASRLKLTQIDHYIRLITKSEDNIGEIILEILST